MTRRQRRNRIILLVVLLALLALLSYLTYYYIQNRRMPAVKIATADAPIVPPQYLYSITGQPTNQLERPVGVVVSPEGRVFVVDFGKHQIAAFTTQGRYLFSFDKTDNGVLRNPVHLAIRGEELFVSDRRNRAIFVYDMNGKFKRRFELKNEPDYSWGPLALAFTADGALRATDVGFSDKHRIQFVSADGSRTATVGTTVQATSLEQSPGGFYFPDGIAVSKDGRVFVSDGDNRRIQVFSPTGEFKYFIDTSGVPRGVAIDDKQRLYVVDAVAHSVDIYNLAGKRLAQFGTQGFGPGQFSYPNDVTIDQRGRIYVSDRENNQVQVWGWPVAAPPAIKAPSSPLGWAWCLLPLLLLFLPFAFRKAYVVVTPEFVDALSATGELKAVSERRRLRLTCPEEDHGLYEGRVIDGIDLGEMIRGEVHSESEVRAMMERLEVDERTGILLSMAARTKGLGAVDPELRRLGALVEVRVISVDEFLAEFVRRQARS